MCIANLLSILCSPFSEVAEMEDKPTESEIKTFEEDDEDLLDEDVVDLRSFSPMGPVAFIELLELPPQKQKVDHWYMQQSKFN